jgi:hypothetical protein
MIEDSTTKKSFKVVSMFYTTILFALERRFISMVRSKIVQSRNRSSGFNVLYHNFFHFKAMAHTNDMIEDCTIKESFEVLTMFYTTILFIWKWMIKVSGTTQDRITNENSNNDSVQIFYFLRKNLHSWYYSGSYNRRTLFSRHLFNFFAYLELQICVCGRTEDPIHDE